MSNMSIELLAIRFIESGLSFKKLERDSNIARSTIHNVLVGKHNPSYPVACLINEALNLSQEDILAIYHPNAKSEKELRR